MTDKTNRSKRDHNEPDRISSTQGQLNFSRDPEQKATRPDKRLEHLKFFGDLLEAEAKGDLQAKSRLDHMFNAVVAKIDAVALEGGSLEDACKKHGVPLSFFARPARIHVADPLPMDCFPGNGIEFSVPAPPGSCGKSPKVTHMSTIDAELKLWVIGIAINTLADKFQREYGRPPELDELEQFVDLGAANRSVLVELLNERNAFPTGPFCQMVDQNYPTFWHDLARNIGFESVLRSSRPDRVVT